MMATRLATARNFITVTSVTNEDNDANTSISTANTTSTLSDGQRTAQLTPVALHHVNLSQVSRQWVNLVKVLTLCNQQKKIILQTGHSGNVSVIDVVPLESSDSSDSQILVAESSNGQNQNGQQVTAQVAVVQAQGSPSGQHFITVSGKLCEYEPWHVALLTHNFAFQSIAQTNRKADGVQKLQYAPLTTVGEFIRKCCLCLLVLSAIHSFDVAALLLCRLKIRKPKKRPVKTTKASFDSWVGCFDVKTYQMLPAMQLSAVSKRGLRIDEAYQKTNEKSVFEINFRR